MIEERLHVAVRLAPMAILGFDARSGSPGAAAAPSSARAAWDHRAPGRDAHDLIDELLDLSRITQGKIVLERAPIGLAHVLGSALIAMRPMLDGARHELRIELPDRQLEIDGDFRRLVQCSPILTNAAKYTSPDEQLGVTVVPGPGKVAAHMQDNGLGIAPQMPPHIFEIFVQSRDARRRAQGGLGIGLDLVRRVVELHGGTVSARSDGEGRGSVFTVELPLRRGAA